MFLTVCANPSVDSFWNVSQIQMGTTNRSSEETFYPGGKGVHTALALSELGQEVTTLGIWGGQTGQWIKSKCDERNISTIGPSVDDWSRICITNRSTTEWDETELLGSGPAVDAETIREFKSDYGQIIAGQKIEAILISGSVPNGFDDDVYRQMVKEAQKKTIPVFLDASGMLLEKAIEADPYAIHVNHKEGKTLSGLDKSVEIARWLSDFCTAAAVTAGAEGLYLSFEEKIYHAFYKIEDDEIYNTIGSGDALLAGLALKTQKKEHPEEWARFASACGSANCIHPQLGMLQAEDVVQMVDQVKLKTIH